MGQEAQGNFFHVFDQDKKEKLTTDPTPAPLIKVGQYSIDRGEVIQAINDRAGAYWITFPTADPILLERNESLHVLDYPPEEERLAA